MATYDYTTGRWLTQDPIGYQDGMNLYEYVKSNPTKYLDPLGTDIYLQSGNDTWNPINNAVHQDVCVDLWECCGPHQKPKLVGKACFSFGMTGVGWSLPSKTWLGWSSLNGGGPLRGQIYVSGWKDNKENFGYVGGTIVKTKKTTCSQDVAWLNWMVQNRIGTEDTYSIARHNCRMYSQKEFDDAP